MADQGEDREVLRDRDAGRGGLATGDAYRGLEPDAKRPAPAPLIREAGAARVLARGARKRCPRCGERRVFTTYFQLKTLCPACGLRFEREEGGWLGAMAINYGVACVFWVAMMALAMALTVPVVPVMPLIAASVVILGGVPVWFYPRSKTLWAALEFLTARTEPGYRTPQRGDVRAEDLR